MLRMRTIALASSFFLCAALTFAHTEGQDTGSKGNVYRLYTRALEQSDAGVVAVPSRFKWSVETSFSGVDAIGRNLPDSRVMLRLYDPDQNLTALTAQMDLDTAERLQRRLAEIVAKKRADPDYQYRPQLYEASLIPTGRFKGVDENGEATIEFEYPKSNGTR